MNALPLIVDVKRDSLEDGPGIRSVVFFKGCPLRCMFCHNPEAQEPDVEIAFSPGECVLCGECIKVCHANAISLEFPERVDRKKCNRCGECVEVCPGKGLRRIGKTYQVEELVQLLLRDSLFYKYSKGGITLSGGECTLYPDYVEALLTIIKPFNIRVVLETSGFFHYDTFRQKILPHVDIIYFDLKFADPETHTRYTGQSNHRIMENFNRLIQEERGKVLPRIPLIPGVTATKRNLTMIANILKGKNIKNAVLLPYNPLGLDKFWSIGRAKPSLQEKFMPLEEEKTLGQMFYSIIQ